MQTPTDLVTSLGSDLLDTLQSASGFNASQFGRHVQPLLDRLAECVQSLPLSRDAYCEHTGALRFGVISGLMAFRMADNAIFAPSHTAEMRRVLDPQYRYGGFAAALASVPAILEAVAIVTVAGRRWSPMNQVSLTRALEEAGVRDYTVSWNPSVRAPSRMVAALVAGRFFVPGIWADFEESVIAALADAILPVRGTIAVESPLRRVVRVAQDKAFEIDGKERARRIDELGQPQLSLGEILALPETAATSTPALASGAAPARAAEPAPQPPGSASPAVNPAPTGEVSPPLSPLVIDLLKAIRVDKEIAKIRKDCEFSENDFRFPKRALGRYGMAQASATKVLVDAGLVKDQTSTHLIMIHSVGAMLFDKEAD
ncbi:TraI domain-containing protein (plasmid) [Cupriavidus basilensis]